jgi:hypothetical protein
VELAGATPSSGVATTLRFRRRRIDGFELGLLAAFAAVSIWVLALDVWQVVAHGLVWTGTDGFFVIDQMQYLAWIRDASHHLLASNLFVLRSTPADYFQPAVAVSGVFAALGLAPSLSLLLWKPVAVVATFFGTRAYVNRSLTWRSERRPALALGLFFASFTSVFGAFGVIGDLAPGFLSWGYPFGLLSLAAMLFALVAYARDRTSHQLNWKAPVLGALASSLHPWQGEVLFLTIVGAELISFTRGVVARGGVSPLRLGARLRQQLAPAAVMLGMTLLPLLYYAVLGKVDLSWGLAREASRHSFSLWSMVLALAPLALPALLAYRMPPRDFLAAATRIWPLAALIVYELSSIMKVTPLHAFSGITVPLAILAIEGLRLVRWNRLPRARVIGWALVIAGTVPATAYELSVAHKFMAPTPGNANFIAPDEQRALDYLSRTRQQGGVLTRFYLGSVVPARTGRRTFVGNCLWSQPHCTPRAQTVQKLFDGTLSRRTARGFVRRSGARFALADCQFPARLIRTLGELVVGTHHFGCATVYELDAPGPAVGPLAESRANAAVRPARRQ